MTSSFWLSVCDLAERFGLHRLHDWALWRACVAVKYDPIDQADLGSGEEPF